MRVAQVVGRMESGGVEAVVMNYYRAMEKEKVQFDFFVDETSSFPQRKELEQLGAGIYLVPPYTKPVQFHKALYKQFKASGYKIVHAHINTMNVFPLFTAWRAKVPVRICHNHSTAHWGERKKTLLKYLLRPFAKVFATDYFACGEQAGRWMYGNQCFDEGKVSVIPNAIDTKRFEYDPEARIRLRMELGIPQDAFVIGHVGRFTYAKNQSFLLEVFHQFLRQWPGSYLLLVGEGELKHLLKEKAKQLSITEHTLFTGVRRDVDKLYSAMDVFCLPSFYEGCPVVALEAQASGLNCVCSDKVPHEIDLSRKVCHLPLQPQDTARWCEQLRIEDGENSRKVPELPELVEKFDIFCVARKIQQFYLNRGAYENNLQQP